MLGAVLSLLEVDSELRALSTIFVAFIAVGASEPCNFAFYTVKSLPVYL